MDAYIWEEEIAWLRGAEFGDSNYRMRRLADRLESITAALDASRATVAKLELRLAYLKQCDCPSCDKCIAVMCGEADDMLRGVP